MKALRTKTRGVTYSVRTASVVRFMRMNTLRKADVTVIGAGLSGLVAARTLIDQGLRVVLVDKGRGLGGRMATRRAQRELDAPLQWNHGVPCFPTNNEELMRWLAGWGVGTGELACQHITKGLVYPSSVNRVAKKLGEGLEVMSGDRVVHLHHTPTGWLTKTDAGSSIMSDQLVLTMPVPQSLDLFDQSRIDQSDEELVALRRVLYRPCLSLMATLEESPDLPAPHHRVRGAILEEVLDQQALGTARQPAVVAHATSAFSREWFDRDRATAGSIMRAALSEYLSQNVVNAHIHVWRFAKAIQRYAGSSYSLRSVPGIHLAGDGFDSGGACGMEQAALSGRNVAERILNGASICTA